MANYNSSKVFEPLFVKIKDENGNDKFVEMNDFFIQYPQTSPPGMALKDGYWKVSRIENAGQSRLINHLSDDVPLYPFLHVDKYRDTIINALNESFGENLTLANIADNIVAAISDKLKRELDNRTITKEDFYD